MSQKLFRINDLATTPEKPGKPAKDGLLPASPATIWRWVREGKFPKPFKLGPSVTVWDAAEVEAFIEAQRQGGAAQ